MRTDEKRGRCLIAKRRDEVHDETSERDDDDRPAADLRGLDEAPDGGVDDERREDEEGCSVHLRREDLGALQAEGQVASCRSRGQPKCDEREHERACIREHVRGIGDEGEGVREDSRRHLHGHESDDERKGDRQAAATRVLGQMSGRVPGMRVGHARSMPREAVDVPRVRRTVLSARGGRRRSSSCSTTGSAATRPAPRRR